MTQSAANGKRIAGASGRPAFEAPVKCIADKLPLAMFAPLFFVFGKRTVVLGFDQLSFAERTLEWEDQRRDLSGNSVAVHPCVRKCFMRLPGQTAKLVFFPTFEQIQLGELMSGKYRKPSIISAITNVHGISSRFTSG